MCTLKIYWFYECSKTNCCGESQKNAFVYRIRILKNSILQSKEELEGSIVEETAKAAKLLTLLQPFLVFLS